MKDLLLESVQSILIKNLDKLEEELRLFPSEESIWKTGGQIKNPAGNLCLHLCGNLQHYIGAVLGKTGYIRNRDNEFAARGITRERLLSEVAQTKEAILQTLPSLTNDQVHSRYPEDVLGFPMTTLYFLIHLATHFGYHLGQVNYHRRLVAAS